MKKFNCMLMIAVVSGLGWGGEVSLNEALDSDELVFEVIEDGGDCVSCNAIWVGQTGESYDGKDAVKVSGREGQLRISNFSGPGVLTLRRCTVYASIWRSSASIWANGDGERLYEHSTLDETGNTIWFQDTLEFFNSGDHSAFVVYSDSDAGTAYQSYGLVDQVTWTPITGPMTIALISDGQEVDSLQVEPGTRFPDLCLNDPPPRNGWTFVGWYRDAEYRYPIAAETEDGIWVSAKSEYVPLTGCALYAKWIKPLAAVDANISISCEGGNPWQLTDLVAPNGGSVLQLQMDPKFSEDVWHGRYFNGEYENGSTLHLQFPGTGFLSFYTMGLVGFSGSEHNRGYSNGLWSRKSCALVSKGEDVSWSWNAWWPWNGGYSFEQVLSVGGIVFEPYGPQATFSDWIEKYYNYRCYVTGDMSRFAAGYAGDTSTKGRILHALTTLITASENPSLVQAIGRFGGLIDYMHRRVTGELILSNPIPGNDFVDLVKGECEPLIKMALADLESVGENFGSVSFTPEECAQFDETVFVDVGDILYLRAVLKGLLGYAYWVRAYDQTVDYPALELDYNNPIDEHGRHRKLAAGSMVSHQQGLFGKLRTRGNLGTAKTLIREALVLVKRADQFCSARSDAALHLFEYDKMNEDQMSRVAALRSNIDTAIDSIDGGTRSFLWKGAFAKSKKEIFGLEDPLPVNLKAVFSGSFKRAMVPASFSSNRYAPNLDLMTDPTFGGIFPSFTTVAKWASLFVANGAVNTVDFYTSGIEPKFPVGTTLSGAFAPLKAKNGVAPYAGAVYDEDGSIVGVVSVKVSKRSVKQGIGSSKVMISVTMFGDKTYRTKSLKVPTGDVPQELTGGIAVGKLGTLINFFIADDGFEGTLRTDFGELKLETASVGGDWVSNDAKVELVDVDLSAIPGVVQTDLLPVGQQAEPIILKRGKWSFRKATSVKWSKPKGEVAKRLVVDETKNKANRSGLKLTYTPKTGLFKGSFKLFALEGNGDKVKLKKYTVKVTGAVIDGIGYGSADLSKPHCRWKVLVK